MGMPVSSHIAWSNAFGVGLVVMVYFEFVSYPDYAQNPTVILFCIVRQCVRVVKEMDSKSIGLRPRRFESCRCRTFAYVFVSYVGF